MYLTRSGLFRPQGLSSSHQSLGDYFEEETPWVLLNLTDQVFPALKSAFLYASPQSCFCPFSCLVQQSIPANFRRAARHSRRRAVNWSSHQYIEPLACLRLRRSIEQSQAATTFCLAERTVASNDPAGQAEPSSSMSPVSSRCSRNLSLLTRLMFQEELLPLQTLPLSIAWRRCFKLNSMYRWSLKVVSSRTDQSPILEARQSEARQS